MWNEISEIIQAVVGVIIIILLVVIFAPILWYISSTTHTEIIGYVGIILLVVFAAFVIIFTLIKFNEEW